MNIQISRLITLTLIIFNCTFVSADTKLDKPDASALYGKWSNLDTTFYFSDGTVTKSPLECWTEFSQSRIIIECRTNRRIDRAVYIYRLVGAGKYEAKVIENKNFPSLVGSVIKSDFRMDGKRLIVTSYPPAATGGELKMAVKVESIYIRE